MSSTALLYALLSGILPSFIWIFFWLREDRQYPEPRSLLVACFFGGMLAVGAAVFIEQYIAKIYTDPTIRYTLWAATEEILKFIAIALIGIRSQANDEPIDAMIYCIVVGLGFSIGYFFYHCRIVKIIAAVIGIIGAIAIHAIFNLSIIEASSNSTLQTFSWIWGAVVIMIILFEEIKVVRPKLW